MSEETQESKPQSTFERIEMLERNVGRAIKSVVNSDQMSQQALQQVLSLEQSYAALAKTLSAIASELEATKVLDGMAVMRRIKESDENEDRQRVQAMLDEKVIQATEVVTNTSLVVVKQACLEVGSQGSRSVDVTSYRIIEIPSAFVPQETRQLLLDRRVGDTVEVKRDDRDGIVTVLTATVLEVYELAERSGGSEA